MRTKLFALARLAALGHRSRSASRRRLRDDRKELKSCRKQLRRLKSLARPLTLQTIFLAPGLFLAAGSLIIGLLLLVRGLHEHDVNKICASVSVFVLGYGFASLLWLRPSEPDLLWGTHLNLAKILAPEKSALEMTRRYRAWHGDAPIGAVWDELKHRERVLEDAIAIHAAADEGREAVRSASVASHSEIEASNEAKLVLDRARAQRQGAATPRKPHRL